LAVGKLSGAVGTYAHILPEIEVDVMRELMLGVDEISTQIVSRERHAEAFCLFAQIGGSLEKLATQIRHLSRSEVAEVAEGHGPGYKGSSAMPHKQNPIGSENICGLARLLRGYAQAAMENVALWHERDISHSSVERIIAPDACGLLYYMAINMTKIIDDLCVFTDKMKGRVEDNVQWISQAVMLRLIEEGMSRKDAHDLVQKSLEEACKGLKDNSGLGIERHLTRVDYIFDRVLR
jgi:adenylosuccinate lyase